MTNIASRTQVKSDYSGRDRFGSSDDNKYDEKVVQINRVSKKTKGGNRVSFSALTIVGDHKGKVGVGLGKAPSVASAIRKSILKAKKNVFSITLKNDTIPYQILIKRGAANVLLKPAPKGTGIIAGGAVRVVVEAVGIKNIVAKILGSGNKASNIHATIEALKGLKTKDKENEQLTNQS
jgi:small subunit ribosomal protein S5